MKKLIVSFFVILSTAAFGQNSCCSRAIAMASMPTMVSMSEDPTFRAAHDEPLVFHYENGLGKIIQIPVQGDKNAQAYEIKAKVKSDKYLLVIHEWWGLNDYIKQETDKIYTSLEGKVNVIAIDLYDGKVATVKDSAAAYSQSLKEARATGIIKGVFTHAGPKAQIATLGWCFGGGWALQTSLLAGDKNIATVMYYGSPVNDVDKLKKFHGELLGIFAEQDQWISPTVVKQFDENLTVAGVKHSIKSYNAVHAFANPSNPNHNKEYTAEAYKMSVDFLKKAFKL